MAQSLLSLYTFNDAIATTYVYDYSGNERHATYYGHGLSTGDVMDELDVVGEYAYTQGVGGTQGWAVSGSYLNALDGFAIVCKIRPKAIGSKMWICGKSGHHELSIKSTGEIFFKVFDDAAVSYEVEGLVLNANSWYTIVCQWTGTALEVYVNNITYQWQQGATFTELETNGNAHYFTVNPTATTSEQFNGLIEMISFYNRSLTASEINTVLENASGVRKVASDDRLKTGDLILNDAGGQEVVTWYEEFDEREFNDGEQHTFNDDNELMIFSNNY